MKFGRGKIIEILKEKTDFVILLILVNQFSQEHCTRFLNQQTSVM